jgi:hypothetical protein
VPGDTCSVLDTEIKQMCFEPAKDQSLLANHEWSGTGFNLFFPVAGFITFATFSLLFCLICFTESKCL